MRSFEYWSRTEKEIEKENVYYLSPDKKLTIAASDFVRPNGIVGSGDGKTLYIGSATSEKQLRVYEKGRELGDPTSPWVRYEAQFKDSNRKELPLDMLRDPAGYLVGAYPVLSFIDAMAKRIDVTNAAMAATWKSCRRHLKRQYDATLSFIVKHTDSDEALARVVRTLTSPKLPAWASNEAAHAWPEIVAVKQTASSEDEP